MLRGFREFFLQGKVVHLSAAVIIGTAFTTLVTAVANNWISPLLAAFGGRNPDGLAVTLVTGNLKSVMNFGDILTALIVFAIITIVVYYLVVLPVKEIQLRRMWAVKSRPPEPTEVELLTDIRGLLRQQGQLGQQGNAVVPDIPSKRAPQTSENVRLTLEVSQRFYSRLVEFSGDTPGLLIDYGGSQIVFAASRGMSGVVAAHEFAVGLAYAALGFAGRCRIQMSPRHAAKQA